ncbi:TetR/AcrR family transcriptional regulator [Oscillatoria sp. CS-180]|uniref:TetR/AcrR family transcriptional regulator n=1 Tax=Oscillatoria sp. CS-180 TaxID=3021720 RepID=UPI00232D385A|nr:TetR/AcrR family transcriptional regulator [Oscillatoria sp. CS-180]MDB9529225.1 TetR/AcrR family transcriptional regulator [Oscillatoria sp. CS-180]
MSTSSSRERLIQAASELFLSQGINHTTTRQIANLAKVNEVTLFRNFGNKYGLLQAVLEEAPTFRTLDETLQQQAIATEDGREAVRLYASNLLHLLEEIPALVRSLIGEADQYPQENRQALGQRLDEASHYVARYLEQTMPSNLFPPVKLAGLLGATLIGYIVVESSSEEHHLWESRDDFLTGLVDLLLKAAVSSEIPNRPELNAMTSVTIVQDLPEPWVHQTLQQARAVSLQAHAMAYVLFAAGLEPDEMTKLTRSHHLSDKTQHTVQVGSRQVSVNQWILGKRYGSFVNNPLTKWLKSRKDETPWIFLKEGDIPITVSDVLKQWQTWTEGVPSASATSPVQAKQTWCVEMLTRGITLDNLSILSGWSPEQLKPYVLRAKAKAALEQARSLDQKQ